jgi:hypothetical protein
LIAHNSQGATKTMSDTPLNVGQIVDALSQCDRALPVIFYDSDAERGFGIVFVEHDRPFEIKIT